jgi:hypothetical protein
MRFDDPFDDRNQIEDESDDKKPVDELDIPKRQKASQQANPLYPYDPEPVALKRQHFSGKKHRDEIKQRLAMAIRKVGSPILTFSWEEDQLITETNSCPAVHLLIRANRRVEDNSNACSIS